MTHRILTSLIVTHRGVPIGRTSLIELELPARGLVPAELREMFPPDSPFFVDGFEPLPGYEAVQTIVRRARDAAAKLGYLGPVNDPDSDRRGRDARNALEALFAELEFRDVAGRLVPVDVLTFEENADALDPYFVLVGEVEDATATMLARLHLPRAGDSGHQRPAI